MAWRRALCHNGGQGAAQGAREQAAMAMHWKIAIGAALLAAATAAHAQTSPTLTVREALARMAELERGIEDARGTQWEERLRLMEASQSLEKVGQRLEGRDALRREGTQFLERHGSALGAEMGALDRRLDDSMQALRQAQGALALAAGASNQAMEDAAVAPADRVTLALLARHHQESADLASRRILRMERERGELASGREQTLAAAERQTMFGEISAAELRERHAALARQVAALEGQVDRSSERLAALADQRSAVADLVAQLARQEAAPATAPAPAPRATPAVPRDVSPAEMRLLAAVETRRGGNGAPSLPGAGAGGVDEIPYEQGSAPLVSQAATPDGEGSGDGTRQLFWRAEPVGVRALTAGKIVFAGTFAGYRHLLIVDHGSGWRTLYGNLTGSDVRVGQIVAVGDRLGTYQAGAGSGAEPFWFEVRQGTEPVAPTRWPAPPTRWERLLFVAE